MVHIHDGTDHDEIIRPVNWNHLTAEEAEGEWLDLDVWIGWLRRSYGLPAAVIPPLWHRHDELVWELSALHTAWLNAYHPDSPPAAPLAWHREFAEARNRLRDWVLTCGTKIDRDRPTRQVAWPGEGSPAASVESKIEDRDADFDDFVRDDLALRRHVEDEARAAAGQRAKHLLDRLNGASDPPGWRLGPTSPQSH